MSRTREHRHLRDADQTRGDLERIAVEEPVCCGRRIQQRVYFAPQTLVARTRLVEKGRAFFERPLECVVKQPFNLLPAVRGYDYSRSSSERSFFVRWSYRVRFINTMSAWFRSRSNTIRLPSSEMSKF